MIRPLLLVWLTMAIACPAQELGLKVAKGFRVTLYADHTLANDIYTMTLDEKGQVVVSGRGYVRRLEDTNNDGKADKAVDLPDIKTKTGAMGLLAYPWPDANIAEWFTTADGQLTQYTPETSGKPLIGTQVTNRAFPFSEHGGHAIKIGPDGMVYVISGNDGRLNEGTFAETSPLKKAEGGGLVRFRRQRPEKLELIAGGYRNPYDFDFTPYGDIITYDSDTERDFLLPWYMPTRAYHVLIGANHGWRLPGYLRSLAKRDYYPDTVPMLADMGRGSPTGVCCYRHTQFPEHYRGGVFLLDWTFGKVHYLPLIPEGSSYKPAKPEIFLEATGTNGFAPTAARVAPDGSLFVSIGGRGTRGAVYRVEYVGEGDTPVKANPQPTKPLEQVLDAPQPLDAWSFAQWYPKAVTLDHNLLRQTILNAKEAVARRIRAIDTLIALEVMIDGDDPKFMAKATAIEAPLVRAHVAYALRYQPLDRAMKEAFWTLANDADPRVQCNALQSLWIRRTNFTVEEETHTAIIAKALGSNDQRVRLMAMLVAELCRPDAQQRLAKLIKDQGTVNQRVSYSLANVWGNQPRSEQRWLMLQTAYQHAKTATERTDVIRAITVFFGDWRLHETGVELYSAYAFAGDSAGVASARLQSAELRKQLVKNFPSTDERENHETARLLAMLHEEDAGLITKMLARITRESHPTDDFHYLTVLSLLQGEATAEQVKQIATGLLGLERKLAGRQLRIKQNWAARFGELASQLMKTYKGLDQQLVDHVDLVQAGHVVVAGQLPASLKPKAAQRFATVVQKDGDFPLSADLVRLLAVLPKEQYTPFFRDRWEEYAARDAIIRILADEPDPQDRQRFLTVLETAGTDLALKCVEALHLLPKDASAKGLVPVLKRLQASFSEPKEKALRTKLVALVQRQTGQTFNLREEKTDRIALEQAYQPLVAWFGKTYPAEAKQILGTSEETAAVLKALSTVKWADGNAERGAKIYRDRGCMACHTGGSRIGPDLTGVTSRFSRDDLFTAIANPSRDVAPAFRMVNFDLKNGQRLSGIVIFESADGYIIQTNATDTRRLATDEIESLTPSPKSLMPEGLLKDLRPDDWADLYAYLLKGP